VSGAGKTTTINMLTGMTDISNGTAHVYHINLATHLNEARKMYGVCPQHDILFPTLTVRDHLALFASLKGVPDDEIPDMVTKAIEEVQLTAEDGLQQEAITMSGGQKRRLCLAIALIAESKVVFLGTFEHFFSIGPL
jgi:ABC-type multidrug transport system ATPase subunit